jgi:hypothetical protein
MGVWSAAGLLTYLLVKKFMHTVVTASVIYWLYPRTKAPGIQNGRPERHDTSQEAIVFPQQHFQATTYRAEMCVSTSEVMLLLWYHGE